MAIHLRSLFVVLAVLASIELSGCASITGGTQESVSVETRKEATVVAGADCELNNNKGKWFLKTPGSVQVQRSNDPLMITCNKQGFDAGLASVEAVPRAGMAGNILLGGVVGLAIDHASGAGYDYPNLVQVFMGQSNVISYSYEKGAAPGSVVSKPAQMPIGGASTATQSNSTPGATSLSDKPPGGVTRLTLNADGTTTPQVPDLGSMPDASKMEAVKARCTQLGFAPQTESFGQCMLRLSK